MQGRGPPLVSPWQRGQQRGEQQDDSHDGRRRNNMTINLPAKNEWHPLGGGDKRRCRLKMGGRGVVRGQLTMGGRDDKRQRLR